MNELVLVRDLVKLIRINLPGFIVFRIEDKVTSGIPDIIATGNKKTSFIECKFGDPKFKSKGIQELNMNRLALGGSAFYVIWILNPVSNEKFTYIVEPKDIGQDPNHWSLSINGFNHQFVINHIRKIHDYHGS